MSIKGFKGFDKDMKCRGMQYAENAEFEAPRASLCNEGLHYCEVPFDVLNYYGFIDDNCDLNQFAEVEDIGTSKKDDNKSVTTKLKVGGKIGIKGLVDAHVEIIREKTTMPEVSDGNEFSSGYGAKIGSSGDGAQIGSSGDGAQIGSSGYGAQIGSSGDGAQIGSSGDGAKIGSSGYGAKIGSSGKNSVICCAGHGCKARAKIGSWITLSEWDDVNGEYTPVCVKTEKVDGEHIKEDMWYELVNGEFQEVL